MSAKEIEYDLEQTLDVRWASRPIKIHIQRTPKHKYSYQITSERRERQPVGEGSNLPSVTTIGGCIAHDGFGAGVGWAQWLIGQHKGDVAAAERASKQTMQRGTDIHNVIDKFIKVRDMPEENDDAFMSWHREIGSQHMWVASEMLVVDTTLEIGGTIDAISVENGSYVIWDWKTKDRNSRGTFHKDPKDKAQIAAYARALHRINHQFTPQKAYICYIMRDGSGIEVVDVDLTKACKLFDIGHSMYHALRNAKGSGS